MTFFTNNDQIWEEAALYLSQHAGDSSLVLAPDAWVNALENIISYKLVEKFQPDFFDFVVVHKGECLQLGATNLEFWEDNYSACFANPVFVIFSKSPIPEVDRGKDDFKALSQQIIGLPPKPTQPNAPPPVPNAAQGQLDYRKVTQFLKSAELNYRLMVAPEAIAALFPDALDESSLIKTSCDTVDIAVVSVLSVLDFPYQDLKSISTNYHLIYDDAFFSVLQKAESEDPIGADGGLYNAMQKALQHEDYLIELNIYRELVMGH